MPVMKAPENENGWRPFVPRARATEPTIVSSAADAAPAACLIAGGRGEEELLQVSARQPQPHLRAGASPYVGRLMLVRKGISAHMHPRGSAAKVSSSVSHPSCHPAIGTSHFRSKPQALRNAQSTVR